MTRQTPAPTPAPTPAQTLAQPLAPAPARYVTANDLVTGEVVFRATDGGWVSDLAAAAFHRDADAAEAALAEAQAEAARPGGRIVGPYLAEAAAGAGPLPLHFRERFRATGPSNYPHGKQERQAHV